MKLIPFLLHLVSQTKMLPSLAPVQNTAVIKTKKALSMR